MPTLLFTADELKMDPRSDDKLLAGAPLAPLAAGRTDVLLKHRTKTFAIWGALILPAWVWLVTSHVNIYVLLVLILIGAAAGAALPLCAFVMIKVLRWGAVFLAGALVVGLIVHFTGVLNLRPLLPWS